MSEVIGDVDELISIIGRTAQQAALNVEVDAQRQAQELLDQAHAEAQQLQAHTLQQAQKQAAEERRRLQAQAALDAQRLRLQTREALLEQVWAAAEQRLHTLPDQADYPRVLRRLALVAAQILGAGTIQLIADPKGHVLLTPAELDTWCVTTSVTFVRAPAPGKQWGGLLAIHEDGRRQVDATFATRLALARTQLREPVAARLEVV
ncbi:MAG: V-type ATP synthase subunit E family protein [Caldilineaceae bacterium]